MTTILSLHVQMYIHFSALRSHIFASRSHHCLLLDNVVTIGTQAANKLCFCEAATLYQLISCIRCLVYGGCGQRASIEETTRRRLEGRVCPGRRGEQHDNLLSEDTKVLRRIRFSADVEIWLVCLGSNVRTYNRST